MPPIPWAWILENTPSFVKFATEFLPILAFILNKLPTGKTDKLEAKVRDTHSKFDEMDVADIAAYGRERGWLIRNGSPNSSTSASASKPMEAESSTQ